MAAGNNSGLTGRLIFWWIVCLLFLPCRSDARTVEAEGIGYSREGARQAALRSAVEQCIGVSLAAKTVIENQTTISDKILSQVSGYVTSYSVLSESREYGLVKIRVSADVSMKKLDDDLAAQKLIYAMQNKPRVMVLLDEKIEGREMPEKTATYTFEKQLVAKGFIVVEPEQLGKILQTENITDQASLAFKEGADLIVRGNVQVAKPTPLMLYNTRFYSVPVQINARIVRTDNAQIIVSRTKRIKKNSREAESAAQFGLETGGEGLANELIADLFAYWSSEAFNENRIEMIVKGCTGKELETVEDSIRHFPMTRDLRLRFLEGTTALFDMDLRGTMQEVRAAVEKKQRLGLMIDEVSAHRIVLKKEGSVPEPAVDRPEQEGVSIIAFSIDDIFPSRIGYYGSNPTAMVKIKSGKKPVSDLKISISIPEFMDLPAEQKLEKLPASSERELPFNLAFNNEKISAIHESRTVYGQAIISFMENNAVKERKLTTPLKVFDANAMDWRDEEAIAAFVTFRAQYIKKLASQAIRAVGAPDIGNKDLLHGLALFESLKALGISYVEDPSVVPETSVLDQVQYPHETLDRLSGDCDDLAVLYASLLSAVGIPAAIISYADHVLVMFDTRIYNKNRLSLSADSTFMVSHNGTLWIPVETTMLKDGFVAAWQTASREFHTALAEGQAVSIIELAKAWKKYPPVPVPDYAKDYSLESLAQAVAGEKQKWKEESRTGLESAISRIEQKIRRGKGKDLESDYNSLGIFNARLGKFNEACSWFAKALKTGEKPEIASNNACALLLSGREDQAQKSFNKIYKADPTGRIAINRALCMFVKATTPGDVDASLLAMREAAGKMPSSNTLAEYLGIDLAENAGVAKGDEIQNQQKQKEINLRRLKELIRKRVLSADSSGFAGTTTETSSGTKMSGTTSETSTGSLADRKKQLALPFGGIRGADPEQVSKVKDLLYWFE
jgi:tetratricopeptide (TPR) repeat protein